MGYGTIVYGTKANFEEKCAVIRKIYQKFGTEGWTVAQIKEVLTKSEQNKINIMELKYRNMVELEGWAPDKKHKKWKLTMQTVLLCT